MALIVPDQPSAETRPTGPSIRPEPVATPSLVKPTTMPPVKTLLVVDDQRSVCTSVAYFLEVCGYRTFRAESGQAALELFGQEQIDGVLLDVQMPKLGGFETCTRLHELARTLNRPVKVWFMTGIHYRELKEDCARAGGEAVFQKPFDWPQLLAALRQGLSSDATLSDPTSDPTPGRT